MAIKSVPITLLDGKERNLRFDFNALCNLEEALGLSLAEVGETLAGSVRLSQLRGIIWAGLQWEDLNLTVAATGGLIDTSRLAEIAEKVSEAFSFAFPDANKDDSKNESGSETKTEMKPGTLKSS